MTPETRGHLTVSESPGWIEVEDGRRVLDLSSVVRQAASRGTW